jgi:hypothetical protein
MELHHSHVTIILFCVISLRFAFVEFETEQAALDAIASMHNFELCGRKLRVNAATAQGSGQQGGLASAGLGTNAAAVAIATQAAMLLQSAGVGLSSAGIVSAGSSLENDGFISGQAGRAALMEKLARGQGPALGLGGASQASQLESPVVLLRNLVGPGEVDGELEGEVRDEAGQYGSISRVVIHEIPGQTVLIYVLFSSAAEGAKARAALDKRIFGGKIIRALPYPKEKFDAGVFHAEP